MLARSILPFVPARGYRCYTTKIPKWVKTLNWSHESECASYRDMSVNDRLRITEALCKDALHIHKARELSGDTTLAKIPLIYQNPYRTSQQFRKNRLYHIIKSAFSTSVEHPTTPSSPIDAAISLGVALEDKHIPYAIGGAMAYNLYGIPRATHDLDVNVFIVAVQEDHLVELVHVLRNLGMTVSETGIKTAKQSDMIFTKWGDWPVEIFLSSSSFSNEAQRTRQLVTLNNGNHFYALSAESICVFKMLFGRDKDFQDIENLLTIQGKRLDRDYVRKWVEVESSDKQKIEKWDELCSKRPAV